MKILIGVSLLLISSAVMSECKGKVDSSKVMMFIDTNESELELETMQKTACDRGEKLVIIPTNYKDYGKYIKDIDELKAQAEKCRKAKTSCSEIDDRVQVARRTLESFKKTQEKYPAQIDAELKKIQAEKGSLVNFSISGHDGGGHFGGTKTSLGRDEIAEVLKKYKDINDVKSVLLLGCYTGVPKEIEGWQEVFPDVAIIGGYDGRAPLASRPGGHQYIHDVLTHEKDLTSTADQNKLKKVIDKDLKSIKLITAALYLKPECQTNSEGPKSFYYGSLDTSMKGLQEFDAKECVKLKPKFDETQAKVNQFGSGELEPPQDSTNGELRKIYNLARRYEHCNEKKAKVLDTQKIFGLLFFDGVKKNFSHFYNDDAKDAEGIIKSFLPEELKLADGEAKTLGGMNKKLLYNVNKKISGVDEDALKAVWMPTEENMKNKTRKEIMDNNFKIDGILSSGNLPDKLRRTLDWASKMNSKLTNLDIPFSWHEYTGGQVEEPEYTFSLKAALKSRVPLYLPEKD